MGSTLSDGVKMAIVMVIVSAIITIVVTIFMMAFQWSNGVQKQMDPATLIDHTFDFTAMAVYGDPIPMPNVVAALNLYGTPEVLCVQMEDLKGEMGGTPYPVSYDSDSQQMKDLLAVLRNYYDKKVYVYVATPNGNLQLCVSELPHSDNPDGANQSWER